MAQTRLGFFSLGDPTNIADPRAAEEDRRRRIDLERQRLEQSFALQRSEQAAAQERAALAYRAKMAGMGMRGDGSRLDGRGAGPVSDNEWRIRLAAQEGMDERALAELKARNAAEVTDSMKFRARHQRGLKRDEIGGMNTRARMQFVEGPMGTTRLREEGATKRQAMSAEAALAQLAREAELKEQAAQADHGRDLGKANLLRGWKVEDDLRGRERELEDAERKRGEAIEDRDWGAAERATAARLLREHEREGRRSAERIAEIQARAPVEGARVRGEASKDVAQIQADVQREGLSLQERQSQREHLWRMGTLKQRRELAMEELRQNADFKALDHKQQKALATHSAKLRRELAQMQLDGASEQLEMKLGQAHEALVLELEARTKLEGEKLRLAELESDRSNNRKDKLAEAEIQGQRDLVKAQEAEVAARKAELDAARDAAKKQREEDQSNLRKAVIAQEMQVAAAELNEYWPDKTVQPEPNQESELRSLWIAKAGPARARMKQRLITMIDEAIKEQKANRYKFLGDGGSEDLETKRLREGGYGRDRVGNLGRPWDWAKQGYDYLFDTDHSQQGKVERLEEFRKRVRRWSVSAGGEPSAEDALLMFGRPEAKAKKKKRKR